MEVDGFHYHLCKFPPVLPLRKNKRWRKVGSLGINVLYSAKDGECSRILPHKRIWEATSKSRLCNHKNPEIERFQDFYLYCNHYASFIPGRKVAIQLFDPGRIIRMLQQEMVDSLCQCQEIRIRNQVFLHGLFQGEALTVMV